MPPKGGKFNEPKKMTQKDIQKQMEKEKKQKEEQEKQRNTKAEPLNLGKIEPVKNPKKAVLSTKDIKAKVAEEKRRKEEEERKKKEELERKLQEEQERLAQQEEAEMIQKERQARKQEKKRQKLGVQALVDDQLNEEEKMAQLDELMELLRAEAAEKRAREKEQRDLLKQQTQVELQPQQQTKQEKSDEASWNQNNDDSSSDAFDENGQLKVKQEKKKDNEECEAKKNELKLVEGRDMRSPIVCVLGHVDTGKTSILDKIRASTVQQREEGGITQQIGASFLSDVFIREKTTNFPHKLAINVPGLLIVDTPGHESFANLRSRGSSLADLTILVVDIMHGVEPQTIESIELLKARKAPFIVALNKIDRLYSWKSETDRNSQQAIDQQADATRNDFEQKFALVQKQLGELGYFADFWWNVKSVTEQIAIVPTSARTGEGLCDLLAILVQFSQQLIKERLMYNDETQCTILEVRKTEGFGFTLDCILVNGTLQRGSKIVVAGQHGPIVSTIRNLLTPQEAKEIREASAHDYKRNELLQAAIGCKIAGEDLEFAIAGSTVYICEDDEDEEILKEAVMKELQENTVKANSQVGVAVHGSSLGALEALVGYLRSENTKVKREPVKVSAVTVGPIKNQHLQEIALQYERGHPEYAVILAFDVETSKEMIERAKELKITIISAKIMYHLYDEYAKFVANWHQQEKDKLKEDTVFPCIFKVIAVFHNRNPIIVGVKVLKGTLHLKQPLALPKGKENGQFIGIVGGIENNKVSQKEATAGQEVAVRIDTSDNYVVDKGGLFDVGATLCTRLMRKNIDILKLHYREELKEWLPVVKQIKELLLVQ